MNRMVSIGIQHIQKHFVNRLCFLLFVQQGEMTAGGVKDGTTINFKAGSLKVLYKFGFYPASSYPVDVEMCKILCFSFGSPSTTFLKARGNTRSE
jgi:hypothetical protein